jgi:predicted metal-dependent phosphoesterase TrpH
MIDLHMHTDASDGRSTPEELVARASAVGIRTLSVTDHDTMASVPAASRAAAAAGIELVPGIEMTAVYAGRDVHVLGYYVDADARELREHTDTQRTSRVLRAREIADRLASLGAPIDIEGLVARAPAGDAKSLARPQIARALVEAGHVGSVQEAFDRFIADGCPAYLPNAGKSPEEVVGIIIRAGGVASLAHPGPLNQDELIPRLAEAGLAAVEVYHCAHDEAARHRYKDLARRHRLAVSGGSDYHGEDVRRAEFLGKVGLPAEEFAALRQRAKAASGARFIRA